MLLPEPKIPANQYDDEFRLKIKEYILLHFQDDPSKYDNALTEIMNLKQKISNSYADVETACLLKRYYAQLLMMKNRFPMEEGDPIKVLFCWYDRAMDIAHSATYDDIGFELACVMYNIGAVHASIAVNEGRENEDLWSRTCAIKSEMYGCIAMIHLGCQADDDKRMGARYGYYKIANEHLSAVFKSAEKEDRDTMRASIAFLSDVVGTKLGNAKKENEFIYHERVPGNEELCKDLEGLCKVRPLSFDPLDISVGGEDLFEVGDLAREAGAKLGGLTGRLADVDLPEITSDEGYKAIKKELERLTEHHQKARSNNVELHKALAAHSTNLHLLSLPISELTSKLAGPAINAGSTKEGAALRRVLDKTREMQTQRAQLLHRFTEEMNNDNIAKKLLSERDTDHKEMFSTELKKHDETLKYLDANLNAQEKILSALTEANADFSDYRKKIKASLNTFYLKLVDRLNKLTLAVEGIETAFGAERQRREAEKRSLEEKMAALKRASEAREALADFSISGVPGSRPQAAAAMPAGRPRFGDYKEFYLNKMAASSAPPAGHVPGPQPMVYQPSQPSPAPVGGYPGAPTYHPHAHPGDHYAGGPPSPAPSSIPDSTAYFPHHHHDEGRRSSPAPHHLQYSHVPPMPPMSYAAQAAAQNPALSLPQHLQPAGQSLQSSAHQTPHMATQGRYTPTHQMQSPGPAPPMPPPNLQHVPMQSVQPFQQQMIFSSTGAPHPSAGMQQPHMSNTPHQPTFSAAAQQPAGNYMQQPVYHTVQQPSPMKTPGAPSGSGINAQNQPGPLHQNGQSSPYPGGQQYAQHYSQTHAPSSTLPPQNGAPAVAAIPNTSPIPPVQQFQPNQVVQNPPQTYQPTQKTVSNVDLLDGIIDNTNLPPAMIPQPKSMENQGAKISATFICCSSTMHQFAGFAMSTTTPGLLRDD
ncbi:hypothetical protein TELCIR_10029 [Teladorsagia circumcincta]|uniref:BRO1 domain-containing protein n=1 Tax=Teladorsagia circumcincta TaxID=45464 RepID=A0A2G9UD83_TELCI|nr:hypothetical protein TELCIR_10029 [Teladorsagia circumcincta]